MWASAPYPERICPGIGGLWLVTLALSWPAGGYVGRIRLQEERHRSGGFGDGAKCWAATHIPPSLTALVELDGEGDYINAHLYHDHDPLVLFSDDHYLSSTLPTWDRCDLWLQDCSTS